MLKANEYLSSLHSFKCHNPCLDEKKIRLTTKTDQIALNDDGKYRSIMSCEHSVDPNSLTSWFHSQLEKGKFKLICPVLINSSSTQCGKEWSYSEVRRNALLTESERELFETNLNKNFIQSKLNYRTCPRCSAYLERIDDNQLRTQCPTNTCLQKGFEFCWQCNREWLSNNARCGRVDCRNRELDILKQCKMIAVAGLKNVPSIRACPNCTELFEHNGSGCKNVICPRCDFELCFICLSSKKMCLSEPYAVTCSIAPIQTKIEKITT